MTFQHWLLKKISRRYRAHVIMQRVMGTDTPALKLPVSQPARQWSVA